MTAPPAVALSNRARWALVVSALVTLALYVIPHGHYVAYPLLLISTLVHELGHGAAAIMMGGHFHKFVMSADGSGLAYSSGFGSGAPSAFVGAGGLCGPAVVAALMIGLGARPKWARYALGAFGAFLALALILVVRNWFGAGFTAILASLALLIAIRGSDTFAQTSLLFLAVQLALSVYSRGDYLFMKFATGASMPNGEPAYSDSAQMAKAMGGSYDSYWFWGLMCAIFSAAMLAAGAYAFWRGTHRGPVVRRPVPGGTKLSPSKPAH